VVAAFAFCLAPGCATIVRGTTQAVAIETKPTGATVRHSGTGETWLSPAELRLGRRHRHVLEVSMVGYRTQQVYVRSEASVTWWIIDAFTLGIANAIDAATGGLFDLRPARVHVVLQPEEGDG
jgi:hypothetical protein